MQLLNDNTAEQLPTKELGTLSLGDVFRMNTEHSYDAVAEKDVYMVTTGGKDERVQIVNLYDGLLLQRDSCHKVSVLNTVLLVKDHI